MATVNSARSNFRETVAVPAAGTGVLSALSNIEIHVIQPGSDPSVSGSHVNIYGSRNPSDTVPLANPIVTDATGIVNFWVEPGEYDLYMHDRNGPARIANQTFGWSALSPVSKGIPSSLIRDDAGLTLESIGAAIKRQMHPVGEVIDWWRPTSTYDAGAGAGSPPPGFEICDGRTIAADQHDFGTGNPIVLPDLRNKFVIGADITKSDAAASALGDAAASAPGIRGGGGSNASKNLAHTHGIPDHSHAASVSGSAATDAQGTHSHGGATGWMDRNNPHSHAPGSGHTGFVSWFSTANLPVSRSASAYAGSPGSGGLPILPSLAAGGFGGTGSTSGVDINHLHGIGADGNHAHNVTVNSTGTAGSGTNASANPQTATLTWTADPGTDMRPAHYGLLKIMKVRRS